MSTQSNIRSDTTLLSKLDQWFFQLEKLLALLGGIIIFALIILSTVNVLGRWLFNWPINGYIDWVEQAMAFFAFLGLAYTQRVGGHIRMDIVINRLTGRWLWFSELITVVLMLCITLILIYGSFLHFLRAYQIGDSSLDIDLPTWPAKLVVPVALSILSLRLLLQIWGYLRGFLANETQPIAIPLPETAAEIAQAEAVSLSKQPQ